MCFSFHDKSHKGTTTVPSNSLPALVPSSSGCFSLPGKGKTRPKGRMASPGRASESGENARRIPVTAPATPGTPAPLLSVAQRADSASYERRWKCVPVGNSSSCGDHAVAPPDVSLVKKMGAEFLGTFVLIFAATAAPIVNEKNGGVQNPIVNAASTGLAVMAVILSISHISGAHLNPSLTVAFAVLRHFPWAHVPGYVLAQFSASICASYALKLIYHPFLSGGVTVPSESTTTAQAFFLEFVITFNLLFVVTAVATDTRAVREQAGIAVGATVILNILIAGPSTGGSMNPVRTFGPCVATGNYKQVWIYLLAPTCGAITGAALYTFVKLNREEAGLDRRSTSFRQ